MTIYDGIDKVDASSIKDFANVVYMHGETNVTASKADYFTIGEDGNRRLIVQKPVIAEISDQTYTGNAITLELKVTIGSLILTKGTDYGYSYIDNTNVGTNAKVAITFKGDYASLGTAEKTFTINPAVVFNANGHGTAPDTQPLNIGDKVSRPNDLTAEGYTFGGWFTNSDCTEAYNFDTAITGGLALYAKWTAITYGITYDLDGGILPENVSNPASYTIET